MFQNIIQGGAIEFSSPSLHGYAVEGMKILLTHPVENIVTNQL